MTGALRVEAEFALATAAPRREVGAIAASARDGRQELVGGEQVRQGEHAILEVRGRAGVLALQVRRVEPADRRRASRCPGRSGRAGRVPLVRTDLADQPDCGSGQHRRPEPARASDNCSMAPEERVRQQPGVRRSRPSVRRVGRHGVSPAGVPVISPPPSAPRPARPSAAPGGRRDCRQHRPRGYPRRASPWPLLVARASRPDAGSAADGSRWRIPPR